MDLIATFALGDLSSELTERGEGFCASVLEGS